MQTGLACGQPLSGEDSEESFKKKKKAVMTIVMQRE